MDMISKTSESSGTQVAAEILDVEDDVFSEDKVSDIAHGAVINSGSKNNINHDDVKVVSEPLVPDVPENSLQLHLERSEKMEWVTDVQPMK
jgi:hypothetical protein